jgi:streptogramin lyase
VISYLNPANDNLRSYAAPAPGGGAAEPIMVEVEDDQVWYTDQNGRIGKLNYAAATPSENINISPTATNSPPSCSSNISSSTANVGQQSGQLNWSSVSYNLDVDNDGWQVYNLPQGAAPWGLAVSGRNVWFNDQGTPGTREPVLGWIDLDAEAPDSAIYLPIVIGN